MIQLKRVYKYFTWRGNKNNINKLSIYAIIVNSWYVYCWTQEKALTLKKLFLMEKEEISSKGREVSIKKNQREMLLQDIIQNLKS